MDVIDPRTGEVVAHHEEHGAADVERALAAAACAFPGWRATPLRDRAAVLTKTAQLLRERVATYAELVTTEVGKPIRESRAEVEKCAWACDYYAENAETFLAPQVIESDGSKSYVRHDPLGVILAVMPWNFPFWQVFRFAAPTLAAGNVALLKHAESTPGCALACEEVLRDAGLRAGGFATLLVGHQLAGAVLRDDRVAGVSLTGSERAGRSIAALAGEHLKPSLLELGGSDPFVVLADADLEAAAKGAVKGRFINGGQSCIAAKRFIVVDAVYDDFVAALLREIDALVVGDPFDEATDVGPLARADLRDGVHRQVVASVELGARCLRGGAIPDGPGFYYPPTVLADVTPAAPALREEVFGPVVALVRAADTDEAIALANDTTFGLGASLWSRALDAHELAARVEAGHVALNGIVKSDPRLPFGGVKRSGYGRELSRDGILAFVNRKTVWVA
jgi:succinate-semialdehyde dehydrogenase/glutarate-semialdehyde dehydrogenase